MKEKNKIIEIDIEKFKDVYSTQGNKNIKPRVTLGRQGLIILNKKFISQYKINSSKSLDIKISKENEQSIILLNFLNDDSGTFAISNLQSERKSFTFRRAIEIMGYNYKQIAQIKPIILNPKKIKINNITYFKIIINHKELNNDASVSKQEKGFTVKVVKRK